MTTMGVPQRMRWLLFALLFCAPVATLAAASDAAPSDQAVERLAGPGGAFSAGSLLQLLLGLALVIGMILALAWAARRTGFAAGINHADLKVIATLTLGARERVVLVQIGEQQMLLGVAPGRVNLLQTFETPLIDPSKTPGSQFAERLREALHRSRG